jgi:hypothetical protein
VPNLTAGDHTWRAEVVLQDARYARDLKTSIAYFAEKVSEINDRLAEETDPY